MGDFFHKAQSQSAITVVTMNPLPVMSNPMAGGVQFGDVNQITFRLD